MQNFLSEKTRNALHSYTHAGLQQLGRRFWDGYLRPNYSDEELVEAFFIGRRCRYLRLARNRGRQTRADSRRCDVLWWSVGRKYRSQAERRLATPHLPRRGPRTGRKNAVRGF